MLSYSDSSHSSFHSESSQYTCEEPLEEMKSLKKKSKLLKSIDVSNEHLVTMSVRDLNHRIRSLPPDEVTKIKQLRRTLKNRGYAANCRERRLTQKQKLELERNSLKQEVEKLKKEFNNVCQDMESLKSKFEVLQKFASSKLAIRATLQVVPRIKEESDN